jgi:hypothetical protein
MPQRVGLSVCSHILNRATGLSKSSWRNAEREIRDLMAACFGDPDLPPSSLRTQASQLAADFKLISRNKRPLSSVRCQGITERYLNQRLRVRHERWLKDNSIPLISPISHLRKKRLKLEDHKLIQDCANWLQTYFEAQSHKRGAKRNSSQTAALLGLAEIFCRALKSKKSIFTLPHSDESQFIQFCVAAFEPYVSAGECTQHALEQAWKRLKIANAVPS